MFYTYRQNNSGGSFDYNESAGISVAVIVEADSADEANRKAEEIGLYWDGAADEYGPDCQCCGDRWDMQWSDADGTDSPEYCGRPIKSYRSGWAKRGEYDSFVHYKDGRVVGYGKAK